MKETKYTKIQKENIKRISELMDARINQIKKVYPFDWWKVSIEDEHYKYLCQQLVNIKATNIYPVMQISEENIEKLVMGMIKPEEFILIKNNI
jgi:hypothetical protein